MATIGKTSLARHTLRTIADSKPLCSTHRPGFNDAERDYRIRIASEKHSYILGMSEAEAQQVVRELGRMLDEYARNPISPRGSY